MSEFVLFDPVLHSKEYFQLILEHRLNTTERIKKNHQIDLVEYVGQPILEYVKNEFRTFASLKPPDDVVYLLFVEGKVARAHPEAESSVIFSTSPRTTS